MVRRESDLAALCETRLGRLAVALRLYARDYENVLPPAPTWMDALESVVPPGQRELVFHCPKVKDKEGKEGKEDYGYAFNAEAWIPEWQAPRWFPEMYPPEKVVLIYETTQKGRNRTGVGKDIPDPGRHQGKNYYLFADFTTMALTPNEARRLMERGELLFKPMPRPPSRGP